MKNFENLNENEIIKIAKNGDSLAKEFIIKKYKPLAVKMVRKYYNCCQGNYYDDILSEAIYGILSAIDEYEQGKASFCTFCFIKVRYYVQNSIRPNVKDSKNYGTSFDTAINNDGENAITLYDVLPDNKVDIEKDFVDKENKNHMWTLVDKYCTPNEINTLRLLATDGMTYEDVAKHLDTTVSAIVRRRDRAIKKIQKHL